ncbi:MAG TPA: prenyltransferase/squalene oxidase repeat-containing protein [Verrucomicrobiae bacterium]|nr:prenyltransferase/squalene oxidase repeat-containing protein [Verrucomicrobiae bacterium]
MLYRNAVLLGLSMLPVFGADWNPRLAADYLDARQKVWFGWPRANGGAKPCISCHTGVTYLIARPALRTALGESVPTQWETGYLESLRSRLDKRTPDGPAIGVESVMAALFLRTPEAFDRMLALQIREGPKAGSWKWYMTDMDPWEEPESELFGAALGAMALAAAPAEYRGRPEVRERIAALGGYLRSTIEGAPLQNRVAAAWASAKLPEVLDAKTRQAVIQEVLSKQQPDGGWDMASLGPWKKHPEAQPAVSGSTGYATAFVTLALLECGQRSNDPKMAKALIWLRTHQDPNGGFWTAQSMNHTFKPDSIEAGFMNDAATGFAVRALLKGLDSGASN